MIAKIFNKSNHISKCALLNISVKDTSLNFNGRSAKSLHKLQMTKTNNKPRWYVSTYHIALPTNPEFMLLWLKKSFTHMDFITSAWILVYGNHTRMVFSLKIRTSTVFVCVLVFQIWCPYQYYTLTTPLWGPILNDTLTVSKKITIWVWITIPVLWCLYAYGGFERMIINTYIYINTYTTGLERVVKWLVLLKTTEVNVES